MAQMLHRHGLSGRGHQLSLKRRSIRDKCRTAKRCTSKSRRTEANWFRIVDSPFS